MANETIFYNSDYIVVEYDDLIKTPYLMLLQQMKKNIRLREILTLEKLDFMDNASLFEWYVNRKNKNFLIDLNRYPDKISNEDLDIVLDEQICSSPYFYSTSPFLLLTDTINAFKRHNKLVNGILVYSKHKNPEAKKDMESHLKQSYEFFYDFEEVMEKAGSNSTYFLSDIDHILEMKEKGVLKFSSITLPIEYRYNKINMTEFKYDIENLMKEEVFKLSYFNSCSYVSTEDTINSMNNK